MTYFELFMVAPRKAVQRGYNPSFLDCCAASASLLSLRAILGIIKDFIRWDIEVGEIIKNLLLLTYLLLSPWIFWLMAIVLYFGCKDVRSKIEEQELHQ